MNWFVFIIIALIVVMQIIRRRLISATTIFVFIYALFFVVAPLLWGILDENVDYASKVGIVSFFTAYLFCYIINQFAIRRIYYQTTLQMESADKQVRVPFYSAVIEHNLKWIIFVCLVLLITNLGIERLIDGIRGNIASRSLVEEHALGNLYDYARQWWGLLLVLVYIDNNKRFEKRHLLSLLVFTIITFLFSYTRISLIYIFSMIGIYALLDQKTSVQIRWSLIIVAVLGMVMLLMGTFRVFGIRKGLMSLKNREFMSLLVDGVDFTYGYTALISLLKTDIRITPWVYFKVFFIWVPRSLWANKPYASSIEILRQLGYDRWLSGYSTSYTLLGEAYAVMGNTGFVIYPFFFALLTELVDRRYFHRNEVIDSYKEFLIVYFMVVFILQCYREGVDIAIMNTILNIVPTYFFSHVIFVVNREKRFYWHGME